MSDFSRDLITVIPSEFGDIKENLITGDVIFERLTAAGANSVIMPRNHVPEGSVIGALTFVPANFNFEPWSVYAGIPARKVGMRDREAVLRQLGRFEQRIAEQ